MVKQKFITDVWRIVICLQVFSKQRATTAKIESVDDIGGWDLLSKEDQEEILAKFPNPDGKPQIMSAGSTKVSIAATAEWTVFLYRL